MALRILLADDSMTAQNMGKKILTDAGFDVVTVSNGAAAAKKLAEGTPDIAILDVYMPGYTGLELCERLKSAPITANVPVLLSVGKMEPFRPEDGMKVRADGVIIKPFEATDLVMVIDKLAERTYGPEAKAVAVEEPEEEEEAAEPFEEPAPVREAAAEGLETFAPVANVAQIVTPEPHIEFTSAPKVGTVEAAQVEDLMPTSIQPEEAEEAAVPELAAPEFEPVQPVFAEEQPEVVEEQAAAPEETAEAEPTGYSVTEEPVVEIIEDEEVTPDVPAEVTGFESAAIAEEPGPIQEFAAAEEESSFEVVTDESALVTESIEEEASVELAPDPALLPREEEASLAPAVEIAPEFQESQPCEWTAVESDVADNVDLDLEAEMHEGIAVSEPVVDEPEISAPIPAAPLQQAAPFLAPLGKTSYDELEAVMEEHAAKNEFLAPVVGEEIPLGAPIADPAEQEPALTPHDEISVPIVSDEILGGIEAAKAQAVVIPQAPVQQTEEAPVIEEALPEDSGELLETGDASKDPLAFYGINEDESGDILHNPIDELDEPLFSVSNDLAPIPQVATSDEEALLEDVPADILESEPAEMAPTPQAVEAVAEPEVLEEAAPVMTEEAAPAEAIAEPTIIEEAVEPIPFEEMAGPEVGEEAETQTEQGVVTEQSVVEDAGTPEPAAVEAATESTEPEIVQEQTATEEALAPEPAPAAPEEAVVVQPSLESIAAALPLAAVAAATAGEVKSATEQSVQSGENASVEEVVAGGMVGRVVDRVVDRLKPILTVMVEELLKEVKK